ncbi:MAG: hypothetical protein HY067_20945 [Betaproteobacteria bacterium]|nr:hypothetical protein [Betaproteobacteria bacterium]
MKRLPIACLLLILFAGTVSAASADCYKDGRTYRTDEVVNGFRCTADGKWVKA